MDQRASDEIAVLWWPAALVAVLFVVGAWSLIFTGFERGRGAFDQINYHEPAILRFAEELPRPDVSDYLSATTPGYHVMLAVVARTVSATPTVLQCVGSLLTALLLVVFVRWLTVRVGGVRAFVLGVGLASSLYVFSAGTFLLPDNAAWLGVLGVVLVALRPKVDAVTLVVGGLALLWLVLVRQSHLWAAGVLWAAGWLGAETRTREGVIAEIGSLFEGFGARLRRTLIVGLATLPAVAVVGWFVWVWGGLTVPIYHDYMHGVNLATPAFILAQLGVIAAFHVGYWWRPGWRLVRTRPVVLVAAVLGGAVVALIPETTYNEGAGRFGGLWNITARAPDLAGHTNSLILVLAMGGAGAVAAWLAGVTPRQRWVLLAVLCGFVASMTMVYNAWQRYHEPMLLMLTGIMSALVVCGERGKADTGDMHGTARSRGTVGVVRLLGPAMLAVVLASVTVLKLRGEPPVGPPLESQDGVERPLKELWPSRWARVERATTEPGELNSPR